MSYNAQHMDGEKHTRPMTFEEAGEFKGLQSMAYEYDNYLLPLFPSLRALAPQATKISQLQCIPIFGNLVVFYITCKFISRSTNIGCIGGSTIVYMLGYSLLMFIVGFIPFVNVWLAYKLRPLYKCWQLFSSEIDNRGLYYGVSKAGMLAEFPVSELTTSSMYHLASPPTGTTPLKGIPYEIPNDTPNGPAIPIKAAVEKHHSVDSVPRDKRGYSSFIPVQLPHHVQNQLQVQAQNQMYGQMQAQGQVKGQIQAQGKNQGQGYGHGAGTNPRSTMADSEYDAYSTRRHSFDSMRASTIPEEADFLKKGYTVRQSHLDNWPLK
ncbi:hypothetical protein BX661DRAFT_207137 [Kickxella alabastrina]|uniref:uncharacterized protein n=1 Tax=Kickxella alabastrina TaxID=61397 RepID=UPI002220D3C9|nr:uncharacterized protein BX661DRAFT_207137 [Kickxella alabastrina]KAI7823132.1 hypothetical protein BX661DRAFT_207137 [Kickxella alabastrina]KAJ1942157.1 hypothetical protein GGF37_003234 [Kickxella alabastrina]